MLSDLSVLKKKYLFLIVICCLSLFIFGKLGQTSDTGLEVYYKVIENTKTNPLYSKVTEEELQVLSKCKKLISNRSYENARECIKNFYKNFTIKNGVNLTFAHMSKLQVLNPEFKFDCHYISHGIGQGQLILDGGDAAKSFAAMSYDSYFRNMSMCGNGYFHGVIEEVARSEIDKNSLVKLLKPLCQNFKSSPVGNCYHGIGHAAFIQTEYHVNDSLFVCDNISENVYHKYECYSGLFMEASQNFSIEQQISVKSGKFKMFFCDELSDVYRPACYYQMATGLEMFAKNRSDHAVNINACKQIKDELLRFSCVKSFAAAAVSQHRLENVKDLCVRNTSTSAERLICASTFASRIGRNLDSTRSTVEFDEAVKKICGSLSFFENRKCFNLVKNDSIQLYVIDQKSLDI